MGWRSRQPWPASAANAVAGVGVGYREPRQDSNFESFHPARIANVLVIVAEEMQETMDREVGEMVSERLALGFGFAADGLIGDDNVAEMVRRVAAMLRRRRRKRQHVGRRIVAAPVAIERTDRRIIGQHDSKRARRR